METILHCPGNMIVAIMYVWCALVNSLKKINTFDLTKIFIFILSMLHLIKS